MRKSDWKPKTLPLKQSLKIENQRVRFYDCSLGESALWISEDYQYYRHSGMSELDWHYTRQEAIEHIKHFDTHKVEIEGVTYYLHCKFSVLLIAPEIIAKYIHFQLLEKVDLS